MFKKLKLRDSFFQLFIVVLGVFLGMWANDWNNNRNLKKHRKEVLKSIHKEIENNLKVIEQADEHKIPFFQSLDSLYEQLDDSTTLEKFYDRPFHERLPNWRGVGGGALSSAMFETAKYSNVLSGMDIKLLEQLSKIYSIQEIGNTIRNTFIDGFYSIDSETKYIDVLRLMDRIRQELGGYEYILMNEYKKGLELIEEEIN